MSYIWAPIEIVNSLKDCKLESNVFIHNEPVSQKYFL